MQIEIFFNIKMFLPGTLERVKNVISEYKRHGITPGKLQQESNQLEGSEKIKAEDISKIYEVYQKKCRDMNVIEIGDIYSRINQIIGEDFKKALTNYIPKLN